MARWRLECKIAIVNGPVGCILLSLRMPKWKSWLKWKCSSTLAFELHMLSTDLARIVAEDAPVEKLADGFKFTDGPVFSRLGYLLFSDIPNNVIFRYTPKPAREVVEGGTMAKPGVSVFRKPSQGANGLTFDRQGRLLACESETRRVTRTEKNGAITVLADRYNGKRLNCPNDLVHAIDGSTYFTDPASRGPSEKRQMEQPYSGVYQIRRTGEVRVVATDFEYPNGIALSPDHRVLYVNDSTRNHIRVFQITGDGKLNDGRVFASMASQAEGAADGMKTDVEANVYSTGPGGIWVFEESGRHLGTITVPEVPANCAWGDDYQSLYITARTSLYRIHLKIAGTRTF
jgi:sugar lactone lactonase YvrE